MARIYELNESYFNVIDSPEKAYFIGLLFSDGNLYTDNRSIYAIKIQL
jgi:intein-encoded DNA endonuclease-like protein